MNRISHSFTSIFYAFQSFKNCDAKTPFFLLKKEKIMVMKRKNFYTLLAALLQLFSPFSFFSSFFFLRSVAEKMMDDESLPAFIVWNFFPATSFLPFFSSIEQKCVCVCFLTAVTSNLGVSHKQATTPETRKVFPCYNKQSTVLLSPLLSHVRGWIDGWMCVWGRKEIDALYLDYIRAVVISC